MRSVSVRLCDLEKVTIPLGFVGENIFTKVYIDCKKIFDEHPDAVPTLAVVPPQGDAYPAVVTKEGDMVIWEVTASDLIYKGSGEMQLAFVEDEMIGKTWSAKTKVYKSIEPSGEVPEPIQNWLDQANATLALIPEMVDEAVEKVIDETVIDRLAELVIDDAAGAGVTDRAWSADKLTTEFGSLPDPTDLIEDTAGVGTTDKTWSANKILTSLNAKAGIVSPSFSRNISMGRKSGTSLGNVGSVAIGNNVEASGASSFACGSGTKATGSASFAEGQNTEASSQESHAEGLGTKATNIACHAEGAYAEANGYYSHAHGFLTIANGTNQTVLGKCNVVDNNDEYIEIVGNGTNDFNRSNARTLDWNGNESLAGSITLGKGTADEVTLTAAQLKQLLALLN